MDNANTYIDNLLKDLYQKMHINEILSKEFIEFELYRTLFQYRNFISNMQLKLSLNNYNRLIKFINRFLENDEVFYNVYLNIKKQIILNGNSEGKPILSPSIILDEQILTNHYYKEINLQLRKHKLNSILNE